MMRKRIEQLEEDTRIAVTYIAYIIYLVSSVCVFFGSMMGLVPPLLGFMMFIVSIVGVALCGLVLYRNRERLQVVTEILLPKKVKRKIKRIKKKFNKEDDPFGRG